MEQLYYFVISYSIIFFGTFAFMNFLTKGFIMKFIFSRLSSGKKVLIQIHGVLGTYFKLGKVKENVISYKEGKEKKSIVLDNNSIQDFLGCKMLETDSSHNSIRKPDFSVTEGFDATTFDNLLVRALNMPKMDDKIIKIILIIIFVVLILVGFVAFKIFTLEKLILAIPKVGVI